MDARTWRRIAIVLGLIAAVASWRAWLLGGALQRARAQPPAMTSDERASQKSGHASARAARCAAQDLAADRADDELDPAGEDGRFRITVADVGRALLPAPGEPLAAYRDRMVPLAVDLAGPFRRRVDDAWQRFAHEAALDDDQRAALGHIVDDTAHQLRDRMLAAVLAGEIVPPDVKPSAAVGVARDLLALVDDANRQFVDLLDEDQRTLYQQGRFDVAEYLAIATPWEDLLWGRSERTD